MNSAAILLAASALMASPPQGDRSLTDLDNATLLVQVPSIPVPEIYPVTPRAAEDTAALKRQILTLRTTVSGLTESLALANNEAEVFKRQASELSLRLDALGVPGLENKSDKLEQRLLAAVRDLRLQQDKLDSYRAQLASLTETFQLIISEGDTLDPQLRMAVEAQLRKTNELLGAGSASAPAAVGATLTDAMVIEVKPDISLVIANVGSRQGVKLGMPFQVLRDGAQVGIVRVVDLRDGISGAIIQSLDDEKETIKIGDRLKVDAKK